jgi:dTDP-4-dehydrorhamnose 3,5-epimerase
MQAVRTRLDGLVALEPAVYGDERGFFSETYRAEWNDALGLAPDVRFVQDNHSRSTRGVVRGMHFQVGDGLGKLVRCARGRIFDVAVDVRRGSPTYRRWVGVTLSADNFKQCWVPPGFAHGFCVMSDVAQVEYKCTDLYDPRSEIGLMWNDPALGVTWPIQKPILSPRDQMHPRLRDLEELLPVWAGRDWTNL